MNAKTLIKNSLKKPLHHCKFRQSSVKCCSLDQFLSAGCELGELWKRQLLCYTHQPFTIPSPVVSDTILFGGKQNKKYEYKYKDKIHICTHQQITVATCIGLHTLLLVKDKYKYAYQSLTTHSYIVSQVALLLVQQWSLRHQLPSTCLVHCDDYTSFSKMHSVQWVSFLLLYNLALMCVALLSAIIGWWPP